VSLLPVRLVVFSIVWLFTWGKLSFWLLPNLTEDVGFLDSFRPVYECTYASQVEESGDQDTLVGSGDADKTAENNDDDDGKEKSTEEHAEDIEGIGDYNEDDNDENNIGENDDNNDVIDDDMETSSDDVDVEVEEEEGGGPSSFGANDNNGYEMISTEDIDVGAAENAPDEDVEGESNPATIRRRKGKRRTT